MWQEKKIRGRIVARTNSCQSQGLEGYHVLYHLFHDEGFHWSIVGGGREGLGSSHDFRPISRFCSWPTYISAYLRVNWKVQIPHKLFKMLHVYLIMVFKKFCHISNLNTDIFLCLPVFSFSGGVSKFVHQWLVQYRGKYLLSVLTYHSICTGPSIYSFPIKVQALLNYCYLLM